MILSIFYEIRIFDIFLAFFSQVEKEGERVAVAPKESVKIEECKRCSSHEVHDWSASKAKIEVEKALKTTVHVQSTTLELPGYATIAVSPLSLPRHTFFTCTDCN